ncbi:response regulator [Pseudomonas sp. v388]|uniref:ATP-binding protein n=1 Tax=Pseudomonas sp. v388 TaxID=2479849 RepID=UPI000F7AE618|nr:ATP-binding protein [Pseudomonas sp. v388]RRV10103.1 response regulator [Pseudomonas sp. v388]
MSFKSPEHSSLTFLSGGGEMGALIRAHDWISTPLGAPETWPQSLRSAIGICLHSSFPTAIYWGGDLCLLYNDAWRSVAGERHPAALGRTGRSVWADIWNVVGPQLEAVTQSAQGFSAFDQLLLMERQGHICETYWNYSLTPILGEAGVVAGVFNQGHETTDRVLSDRKREADSLRQRRMFEQAPGFITILGGPNHTFEFVNEAYKRLFGDRDFVGKTIYEAFPELGGQGYYDWLDQVFITGQRFASQSTPIRLVDEHGVAEERFLDFIYEPLLDESGKVTGIFCEGFDVTEAHLSRSALEASEAALREESRNLETLNRVNAELAGDLDLERLIQTVTDAGIDVTGAKYGGYAQNVADEAGQRLHLFTLSGAERGDFARLSTPPATPLFSQTFSDSGVVRADDILMDSRYDTSVPYCGLALGHLPIRSYLAVSVVSRSGSALGGLFYGHPEPGQFTPRHEKLISALASQAAIAIDNARLFQDVKNANETLEQRVEARSLELNAAHAALRQSQKMEAVGQLTGGIAHDFNNLLAGIIGSLEMIERRVVSNRTDGLERYVGAARDSAQRAAVLTQRLLAFSRRQTLDPKPIDVNQLVYGMQELITRTVGPSISLEVVGEIGLWPTRSDGVQLESALLNLAINARDALPDGGRIVIQTSNHAAGNTPENAKESEGDFVCIAVSDNGTGIAPEIIERIFDPFFTTKPLGQGTGLGLSMIHGFVHQSGGFVQADSTVGIGTKIALYLPRYLGAMDQETGTEADGANRCVGRETILVIDDEPTLRMLMSEVLREEGYTVIEAPDGPCGLELLRARPSIELLITDVGLPGSMNGRQVADAARVMIPALKVIFVTGYAETAVTRNGYLENGMAVITKPFAMAQLTLQARELLDAVLPDEARGQDDHQRH